MIHVVGGTYLERCREPAWSFLYGSGFRAALQLRRLGSRVRLHTVVSPDHRPLLEQLAADGRVEVEITDVPRTLLFDYDHALSVPNVFPDPRVADYPHAKPDVHVRASEVVCFGLLEANPRVTAREVVYDPQSPVSPASFREKVGEAERLAVVANRSEVRQLGRSDDVVAASRRLLRTERAEVVVAKMGAAGCLVTTRKGVARVPAFRTGSVFPIGSGDVFTAAFALAWFGNNQPPEKAAEFASCAAAQYCATKSLGAKPEIAAAKKLTPLSLLPPSRQQKVYLASPFFNVGQRWLVEQARNSLLDMGVNVFSPLHDVGHGAFASVYGPDIEGLRSSGVVLACLDGMDPGTLYEIGFAHALGLPVVVLAGAEREEDLKMVEGGGSVVVDDLPSAIYLTAWAAMCR